MKLQFIIQTHSAKRLLDVPDFLQESIVVSHDQPVKIRRSHFSSDVETKL